METGRIEGGRGLSYCKPNSLHPSRVGVDWLKTVS